jgi:2-dehydro-3-deoxyphosphogluconate aldolase / (4S)-4-hydroxy-2-oxoglutarate aldolase
MSAVREALEDTPALAIVRYRGGGRLTAVLRALAHGGLRAAEITIDTPNWRSALEDAPSGMVLGVGTVTTAAQVHAAAEAGARFVVSPGYVEEVVSAAWAAGVEPIPGVYTGTEVLTAARAGVQLFKLFPATAGIDYLRQLRGPFPDHAFIPTGGVDLHDAPAWLDAGAFAVAVGSALVGRASSRDAPEDAALASRAARLVAAVRPSPIKES